MRRQDENDGHGSHGRVFNSISFWPGVPFLSPDCAIFRDGGRQSLEEQPTMDKVVSLLISVGIITFGAWVAAATIAKGWPLVWTLMALFPLLTGFISLYGSIKGTED
jgi:hypothetical protein